MDIRIRGPLVALDPALLLATLGGILVLGYLGNRLFEATRIPDILLLIGLGVLIGPVLGLLQPGPFRAIAPTLGTFALLIILFGGGLSLKFHDILHGMGRASLLAATGWLFTTLLIAAVLVVGFGWRLGVGLLLGAILAGTSSIIVVPLVESLGAPDRLRVTLSLESAITDVLCIVGVLVLIGVIRAGQIDLAATGGTVVARFALGILAGSAAGLVWGKVWPVLERGAYAYMITLAALLLLHIFTEAVGGSGPIAALAFGILLGNRIEIFGREASPAWEPGGQMRNFQSEITFFVRTFFFVLLGFIIQLRRLDDIVFLVGTIVVVGAIITARAGAVLVSSLGDQELEAGSQLLVTMMPRGLAAAVLAALPAQEAIAGTADFPEYAFMAIILTNVIVTVATAYLGREGVEGPGPEAV